MPSLKNQTMVPVPVDPYTVTHFDEMFADDQHFHSP